MASIRITRDPEVAILDLGSSEKNPWSGSPDLIRDLKQQAELMYQEGTLEEGYTPYPDIRDLASAADALQLSYTITYPIIRKPRETETGPGIRYEPPQDFVDPQTWFESVLGKSSKVFFNPYHDKRGRFTFKKGASVTSLSPQGPRPDSGPGIKHANFPQRGKEFETIQRQAKAYGWSVDEYRRTIDMISDRFTPDDVIAGRSLGALQALYKARSETIQRILPRLVLGDGALITSQEARSHLQKQAVLNQTVLAKKIRSLGGVVPGEEPRPPVTPPTTTGTRGGATSLSDYNRPFVKAFTDGLNPGWHRSKEAKEVGHSVAESRDFSGGVLASGLTARFGIRVLPSLMNPGQFEWSVTPHFFEKGVTRGSTKYHGGESTLRGGTILGTIKGVASGVNAAKIAAEEAFETARRLLAGDGSLPVNIASTSPLFTLPKHGSTPTITAPTVVRPPTVTPPTITAPTVTTPTTTPPVATSTTRPKAGTFTGGDTKPGNIRERSLTSEIFGEWAREIVGPKAASVLTVMTRGFRDWEGQVGSSASLEKALQAVINNPKLDRVIENLEKTVSGFAASLRQPNGGMVSAVDQVAAHRRAILEGLGVDPKVLDAFPDPRKTRSGPPPPGFFSTSPSSQPDSAMGLTNVGGEPNFIGGMRKTVSNAGPRYNPTQDEIRMTEDNRRRSLEGINFIRAIMSVGHPEPSMEIGTRGPGGSLTTSRKLPPVKIGTMYDDPVGRQVSPVEGGRAYYRVAHSGSSLTDSDIGPGMYLEGRAFLRTGRLEETAAHEYGHHLEFHLQDAPILVEKFYQKRTAGEPLVKLKDLFPNSAYSPDEVTKLDKFPSAYMGSRDLIHYPGASEVLSTALGSLYNNPVKLYRDDPELFRLAVGILIRE